RQAIGTFVRDCVLPLAVASQFVAEKVDQEKDFPEPDEIERLVEALQRPLGRVEYSIAYRLRADAAETGDQDIVAKPWRDFGEAVEEQKDQGRRCAACGA